MAGALITIQEAAALSGKSVQTLRRAIKANKVASKRKRTPQGFNYLINRESIIELYKLRVSKQDRKQRNISGNKAIAQEFATIDDLNKVQAEIGNILSEHEQAKQSFMRFMKTFQDRFVVMENQLKLLEEPNNKKWYQFWK
ncbi:hypothetical protein KJ951_02495 [Patescibacteria group bacterium]|nr:hypothetical protein [Patescibacteria group bacterium]MBU1703249.1 hypothetical protein [Patescibacteria group bacterium]MBU1953771.1 hypothetical protein [Patescibacteria group bacterium]